jgi:hypothetical protein
LIQVRSISLGRYVRHRVQALFEVSAPLLAGFLPQVVDGPLFGRGAGDEPVDGDLVAH